MIDSKLHKQYSGSSRRNRILELEDMKKHPSEFQAGFLRPAYEGTELEAPIRQSRKGELNGENH